MKNKYPTLILLVLFVANLLFADSSLDSVEIFRKDFWSCADNIYLKLNAENSIGGIRYGRAFLEDLKMEFEKQIPDIAVVIDPDKLNYYPDITFCFSLCIVSDSVNDGLNVVTGAFLGGITGAIIAHSISDSFDKTISAIAFEANYLNTNIEVLRGAHSSSSPREDISNEHSILAEDFVSYLVKNRGKCSISDYKQLIEYEKSKKIEIVFVDGDRVDGYFVSEDSDNLTYKAEKGGKRIRVLKDVVDLYTIYD